MSANHPTAGDLIPDEFLLYYGKDLVYSSSKSKLAHIGSSAYGNVLCPTTTSFPLLGTGTYQEREHVRGLPLCKRCMAKAQAQFNLWKEKRA